MDKHMIDLYNQALKDYDEAIIKIETLEKELENSSTREARLRSDNYDLYKDLFLTRQKLEKIREYCNKYPQNSIGFKKNILQIIDEVEQ